jgi:hypothetical protein
MQFLLESLQDLDGRCGRPTRPKGASARAASRRALRGPVRGAEATP